MHKHEQPKGTVYQPNDISGMESLIGVEISSLSDMICNE